MRGHVAIITETESTYVMIESTLQFDDVEMYQAFSCFSGRFKGHVCGQENRAGDGLGTRLVLPYVAVVKLASRRPASSPLTLFMIPSLVLCLWFLFRSCLLLR